MYKKEIKLFSGQPVSNFIQIREAQAKYEIEHLDSNELLNSDMASQVNYFVEKYKIEPLLFSFDDMHIESEERDVPAKQHPSDFTVWNAGMGHSAMKRLVITYNIPFGGNSSLLEIAPSSFSTTSRQYYIKDQILCFDIVDFYNDPERIKNESKLYVDYVKNFLSYLQSDIHKFNVSLEQKITYLLNERKQTILKQKNVLDGLGIRVIQKNDAPIAIPIQPKKIVLKPASNNKEFIPEYRIEYSDYLLILSTIHEVGKSFEKLPANYKSKNEEALRDLFLSHLSVGFVGVSITGETFNKSGKTDILIKHENQNLFVAECKFWKGEKQHTKTINQLLSYLTWRDSKTAIIYFVDGQNIQPVLDSIERVTYTHACYVKTNEKKSESWFNYHFTMLSDNTRGVEMAILVFHFPKIN